MADELYKYGDVFVHHIETILQSRLILDEDFQLLLTYWDPHAFDSTRLFSKHNGWLLPACACALVGLVTWRTLTHQSLLMLTLPTTVFVAQNLHTRYQIAIYRRNFESLIAKLNQFYEMNTQIVTYYTKREACTTSAEVGLRLLISVESFLKHYLRVLVHLLETMHDGIREMAQAVPIVDGERIYCLSLDMREFDAEYTDARALLREVIRLNEYYVLLVSNLLGCVALCFCKRLWRNAHPDVTLIFAKIIPKLLKTLTRSHRDISIRFNKMRYSLEIDIVPNRNMTKASWRLRKPLIDIIDRLQVLFALLRRMDRDMEGVDDARACATTISHSLEDVCRNFAVCETSLSQFVHVVGVVSRQAFPKSLNMKEVGMAGDEGDEGAGSTCTTSLVEMRGDDAQTEPEDEEYCLSVHASDVEDDDDYASGKRTNGDDVNGLAAQHIELMLGELRGKLVERLKQSGNRKAHVQLEDLVKAMRTAGGACAEKRDAQREGGVSAPAPPPPNGCGVTGVGEGGASLPPPSDAGDFLRKIREGAQRFGCNETSYS